MRRNWPSTYDDWRASHSKPMIVAVNCLARVEHCIKECEELWSEQKSKTKQKRFFKSQVELRANAETAEAGGDEVN